MTTTAVTGVRRLPPTGRSGRTLAAPALLTLVLAGAAAVLGLWWHDTSTLQGTGSWLTAAGRVTGLLSGYVVAVVLLLMSRAPWTEHGLGADRLARWHAWGGRYLLSLAVAHALLIIWGYARAGNAGLIHETRLVVLVMPDVLLATVGLAVLVVVGIVSARAVRRRVSYETWYFLHLLTYLGIALSFLHVLTVGADFRTPQAKALWITLYAGVGGCLLWYRWIVPIRDGVRHRMRVATVQTEGPGTVSIVVSGVGLDRLGAQPGQFFRWRFLTAHGWWQSHPFSLSAPPTAHYLRITVKDLGDHTGDLQRLRVGTRVVAEGPYGALTPARRRPGGRHGVLLLAGGIGITPLRAMLEHLAVEPGPRGPATLVYRVNRRDEVIFRDELDQLATARHVRVHYIAGPPCGPKDVLVGRRLRQLVPDVAHRDVFLCGPPAFMAAADESLRRCGVPRRRIHAEKFGF